MKALAHTHKKMDTIGAYASFACAVHCMLLPLFITVLPLIGLGFFVDDLFEGMLLTFSVSLAAASLCWGSRIHKKRRVLLFLAGAVVFFITGQLMVNKAAEGVFMGIGGTLLALGHLLNRKLCAHCHGCCDTPEMSLNQPSLKLQLGKQ